MLGEAAPSGCISKCSKLLPGKKRAVLETIKPEYKNQAVSDLSATGWNDT